MYKKFLNESGAAQKTPTQQTTPTPAPPAVVVAQQPVYQPPAPPPAPTPPPAVAVQQPVYQAPTPPPQSVKTYKTVVIGGKTWMAENLNYQTASGSWCYNNDNSNCDKYGRLYDWNTARTVCPAGFHLPLRQEWDNLVTAAGGKKAAGKKLKARSGWNNNGNGTDDFGFSALPSGNRFSDGSFYNAGIGGGWWTATGYNGDRAYYRVMDYYHGSVLEIHYNGYKSSGYSVRCVMDN